MKKILSLILILTMILSVSSVAMAADACTDASCGIAHVASIGTAEYHSLQDAIDAAELVGGTITLLKDCADDVTIEQKPDVKITIDGANKTMSGTITVDGKSAAFGWDTTGVTIKNFKFNSSSISKPAFINLGDKADTTNTRYTNNVTIANCTFDYSGDEAKNAIQSFTGGDKNLTVTDCTVNPKVFSFLNVAGVDGIVIDNCTVNGTKEGINLNSSLNVEIKNSTVSAEAYAVRIGAGSEGSSGDVEMTGNNLKATNDNGSAIILRGEAVKKVDLDMTDNVVSGDTHISGNTGETKISADANYWDGAAAPKTGDSGTPIAVTSYYTDEAKTDLAFSSGSVAKIGNVGYPSLAAAVAAAQNGDTITLLTDCSGDGIVIDKDIIIDFAGHTYTVSGKLVGSAGTETSGFQILKDNEVTLKNGTLTSSETAYKPNPSDVNNKTNTPCRILVQNYADLTLKDMVLDGSKCKEGSYTLSNNSGEVTIEDTEIIAPTNGFAFDVYDYSSAGYAVPKVTVKGNSNIDGEIKKSEAATLEIESGYFSKDPSEYVVDKALVAEVTDGNDNIYAVGEDAIEGIAEAAAAANADITITVTRGSGELELPEGTTVKVDEGVAGSVIVNGKTLKAGETYTVPAKKSGNGIKVKYEGGNSFSTSKSAVPTSVEIDGVPVPFSGDGKFFTVGCIDPNAQWVTVRWNSTSVTTNFNPDVTVSCPNLGIPKTGDMSVWAAIAEFLGF